MGDKTEDMPQMLGDVREEKDDNKEDPMEAANKKVLA